MYETEENMSQIIIVIYC